MFYYLLAGLLKPDAEAYGLGDITDYHYLRGGMQNISRDGAIDFGMSILKLCLFFTTQQRSTFQSPDGSKLKEQYLNLLDVLANVGFTRQEVKCLEQVLVTILHIGNIEFNEASTSYAELADVETVQTSMKEI